MCIADRNEIKFAVVDTSGIFNTDDADYDNTNDFVEYLKGCCGVNTFIPLSNQQDCISNFNQC